MNVYSHRSPTRSRLPCFSLFQELLEYTETRWKVQPGAVFPLLASILAVPVSCRASTFLCLVFASLPLPFSGVASNIVSPLRSFLCQEPPFAFAW
jgi:hypothetical protein